MQRKSEIWLNAQMSPSLAELISKLSEFIAKQYAIWVCAMQMTLRFSQRQNNTNHPS
jgi:hypothetical protein